MLTASSLRFSRTSPAIALSVLKKKCGSNWRRSAASWVRESCSA